MMHMEIAEAKMLCFVVAIDNCGQMPGGSFYVIIFLSVKTNFNNRKTFIHHAVLICEDIQTFIMCDPMIRLVRKKASKVTTILHITTGQLLHRFGIDVFCL